MTTTTTFTVMDLGLECTGEPGAVLSYWGKEIRGASIGNQIHHCKCCCCCHFCHLQYWRMVPSQLPSVGRRVEVHDGERTMVDRINIWCVKVTTSTLLGYGWKLYRRHYSNFVQFLYIEIYVDNIPLLPHIRLMYRPHRTGRPSKRHVAKKNLRSAWGLLQSN